MHMTTSLYHPRRALKCCLVLACVSLLPGVIAGTSAAQYRATVGEMTLAIDSTQTTMVQLPDVLLMRDSVMVYIGALRLGEGYDYTVDYLQRRVLLKRSWPVGSVVRVRYRFVPLELPATVRWMSPSSIPADSGDVLPVASSGVSRSRTSDVPVSNLHIGGSKTFAVQVGSNRDLTLEQSLRVSINGTVGDSVYVTAELSDQNLPIQPEGTTEDLREIDKVMVEVRSPHYRAVLGSYDVMLQSGEFGRYERRLEGAFGEADYTSWGVSAGIASNRGNYNTLVLTVIDGNQGPYALTDETGNSGVLVVAGTERVWLNGELLRRGENNDYIMDYGAGEITFTRRRLMTTDMRIVIDYEYSSENYSRSAVLATGRLGSENGMLSTTVTFVQEGDNTDDPAFGTLTDAARAVLEEAGDSQVLASHPGWVRVDSGGTYRAVDLSEEHFVWVGDGGEYSVSFTRVGPYQGSYEKDESYFSQVFRYVGVGNGDWVPRLVYPLPRRTRLFTSLTRFSPTRAVTAEVEAAASDVDENTLSSVDDDDNTKYAGRARLEVNAVPVALAGVNAGRVSLEGEARFVQNGFEALSRTSDAENARRWGQTVGEDGAGEKTLELTTQYDPADGHRLAVEVGWLDRDSSYTEAGYRAFRRTATWTTTGAGRPTLRAHAEAVDATSEPGTVDESETSTRRGDVSARYAFSHIVPQISAEGELQTTETEAGRTAGDRYGVVSAGTATTGWSAFAASGTIQRRVEDVYDTLTDGWSDELESWTQTYRLSVRDWKGLSANGEYTWRRVDDYSSDQSRVADVADVNLQLDLWEEAIRQRLTYRVAGTRTSRREPVYVYVGDGRGDYAALDPNETRALLSEDEVVDVAAGDPNASYVLQYRDTGEYQPTVELDASWRLTFEPGRHWSNPPDPRSNRQRPLWQRVMRVISTETSFTVAETDSTRNSDLYLVKFWRFRRVGVSPTVRGSRDFTQDLKLWSGAPKGDIRFRYRGREDYDATLLSSNDTVSTSYERRFSIRSRYRIRPDMNWTSEWAREEEAREGGDLTYRIKRWESEQVVSYRPGLRSEWVLSADVNSAQDLAPEAGLTDDDTSPLQAYSVSAEPSVRYAWGSRGMGRVSVQWSGVFAENHTAGTSLPVRLLNGRNPGHNFRWTVQTSFRLSALVSATATYNGRKNAGSPVVHTARAEVRATF